MTNWFKLDLGDAMLAGDLFDDIKAQLSVLYEQNVNLSKNEQPKKYFQVLSRYESNGMHCHLILYLTAELQGEALLAGAVECEPPQLDGCELLFK